ncbi:Mucolipin-3-like [Homarus americanus]|uniref:Mucolipin-3-like n=1 Tax=Homarus americanus TaxID=6706 RepID=A0A8J5JIE3_HOMAM|nr:Mucolipin-3-like [Homarus americanus]
MNAANHAQCHRRRGSRDERGQGGEITNNSKPQQPERGEQEEETTTAGDHLLVQDGEEKQQSQFPNPQQTDTSMNRTMQIKTRTSRAKPRGRSGSWSGVNESDDELEKMAQALSQPPPEIKVSSAEQNGGSRYGSITSSINSTGQCSPLDDSLCLFAQQRYNHVNYLWDTKISFSHLFLQGWDTTMEIQVYPPPGGPLAVYKKSSFFEYLDYAAITYANIHDTAIGTYAYMYKNDSIVSPTFCTTHYVSGEAFLKNNSFILDNNTTKTCINIPPSEANVTHWSSKTYLEQQNFTLNFDLLLNAEFEFILRTIKLRVSLPFDTPECYCMTSKVQFNNHDHDGQMLVDLQVGAQVWRMIINVTSILICVTSLIMCVRAIYRAQILRKATASFFHRHYGRELTLEERMEFLNLWYVLICVNDILIIIGSFFKIGLESKFRTFSSTMECLYSLINGDDMFATFSSTSGKDPVVWWFSRAYLYSFISLFIYVILSLFIAIIMDAYETVKHCYDDGFPESGLMKFVNECTEEPSSGVFHDDGDRTIHDVINSLFCCGLE